MTPRFLAVKLDRRFPAHAGRRQHHLPQFRERLHIQAERVEASASVRKGLARGEWDELHRRLHEHGAESAFEYAADRMAMLRAARELPELAATGISELVASVPTAVLRETPSLRESIRPILEHIAHRRISRTAFEMLEATLFRFASIEDQPWVNNSTHIWQSLFLVVMSLTHHPWRFRFDLLRRRCGSVDASERLLAVKALGVAASHGEQGRAYTEWETADGEWRMPTWGEVAAAKSEAWRDLVNACSDGERDVSAAARTLVAHHLRGGLTRWNGVDADLLRSLTKVVEEWAPEDRRELEESIADVWRYDAEHLSEAAQHALKELQIRLVPSTFEERMIAQVGSWHPGPLALDDPERSTFETAQDEALASESVASAALLLPHLPWLETEKAKRAWPFLRVLGRRDQARTFLPWLEERYPESERTLAAYVLGWADSDSEVPAMQWIERAVAGAGHDALLSRVLPMLPASNLTVGWITTVIDRGGGDPNSLRSLGYMRGLVEAVDSPVLEDLIRAAAEHPTLVEPALAILDQVLSSGGASDRIASLAARILRTSAAGDLGSMAELHWVELFEKMLDAGARADVMEAVTVLLRNALDTHNIALAERVLRHLLAAGLGDELWQRSADDLILTRASYALRGVNVLESVRPSLVLAWVGDDEDRGARVAALSNVHSDALGQVTRSLLSRFGASSRIGSALSARVFSTRHAVHDFADFYERQLANALRWASSSEPEVRAWSRGVADALRSRITEERARSEFERRYA